MPKFTLIAEHDDSSRTTVEFERDFLPDVIMQMDMFLRGTGFVYDGTLSIESFEDYTNDEDSDDCESGSNQESFSFKRQDGTLDTITITGTAGAAGTVRTMPSKCYICGLTDEQLGHHACFDQRCPKRPATYTMAGKL
jgi:hypothetical protein